MPVDPNAQIGDLMLVAVRASAAEPASSINFPNIAALVKRGESRPAFQRALSDHLAVFREHEPNRTGRSSSMTYFEGFIVPVPEENQAAYRKHASDFAPIGKEIGVRRHLEAWESDVPEGKVTDFRKAVDAKPEEKIVFALFEYPSKSDRDATNERFMSDPRMEEMGKNMPFDGKRMIVGGFDAIVEEGSAGGSFTDGFVVPVPEGKRDAYQQLASKMAKVFRQHGATRVIEAIADDVPHGKVTDFYRAVKAEDGETVVFSFIEWPDKQTRDDAWAKIMEDETLKPQGDMPFSGQRMFWGGFDKIVDTSERAPIVQAGPPVNA